MAKSYSQYLTEDRRLVILRILNEAPGYEINSSIIVDILGDYGHTVGRDRVHSDFSWLSEQGLCETHRVSDSVHRARLTQMGADVAEGRSHVPGVKRPGPGA